MQLLKKTKIVATLGPACSKKEVIKNMVLAGVNVFRINFSHASYDDVAKSIKTIREINAETGIYTAILADLQGPKLRVGVMEEALLKKGDIFTFTTEECVGNNKMAYMTYQSFPQDVKAGEQILVDDGKLLFEVIKSDNKKNVTAKVIRGGELKSKKGVNLPNTNISQPALTEKDINDAIFAIGQEVDWMALSFVRTGEDLKMLHDLIKKHSNHKIPVIAKIEKPEAVKNIDDLIPYSDGFMVARGDLGVEIPMNEVPLIQKKIVLRAKQARIPVIIATQMMESMITSLVPTRAEVNDVANSIMDGADAVMLSGETSVGMDPLNVIEHMTKIIASVEDSPLITVPIKPPHVNTVRYISKSICYHAANMANDIDAKVISTLTNSGYTAFQVSAWRPKAYILAFTSNKRILTMLNLLWGVEAFYYSNLVNTDTTIKEINQLAIDKGFLEKNDYAINLTSMPVKEKGMVNTLRLTQL